METNEVKQSRDIIDLKSKQVLDPQPTQNNTRRDVLVIGGAVLTTVFSGAGFNGYQIYDQWKQGKQANIQRTSQAWFRALELAPSTLMFAGDDFSLYPASNKWKKNRLSNDPRATDLLRNVGSFVALNSSGPQPNLRPFNPSQHSSLGSIILAGAAINNRAARAMLGSPLRDRYSSRFVSLDKQWEADLKIGQFTPKYADVISGEDFRIGTWDFGITSL